MQGGNSIIKALVMLIWTNTALLESTFCNRDIFSAGELKPLGYIATTSRFRNFVALVFRTFWSSSILFYIVHMMDVHEPVVGTTSLGMVVWAVITFWREREKWWQYMGSFIFN